MPSRRWRDRVYAVRNDSGWPRILALCYNPGALGIRLAVGQRTLDTAKTNELLSNFLKSRRQGLSHETLKFYRGYLSHAVAVVGLEIAAKDIANFLGSLQCSNGGKHAYYRALRAFYGWLYSRRSGYGLNTQDNPMLLVDVPKVEKRVLPSLTENQIGALLNSVGSVRDRCIISLLADSGIRLRELASIKADDINWDNCTVTIWGKGGKQRRAPFTARTADLLKQWLDGNSADGNVWGINRHGIQKLLKRLRQDTGVQCNPHAFRRGFACNLHRKGLSTLDIMHLGGWSDLSMVLRYTRSITFEDCLEHYRKVTC